jgi:hypothetical protein
MQVSLDGTVLAWPGSGNDVRVDPGRHVVRARAPGHRSWEKRGAGGGGGPPARVEVPEFEPGVAAAAAGGDAQPITATPRASEPEKSGGQSHTAAYVAGGIGLAGLGVAALSAWHASSVERSGQDQRGI